jgi:hypothetical protein
MSLILIEGFDVYPNVAATSYGINARWVSAARFEGGNYQNLSLVAGRFGGQAVSMIVQNDGGPSMGFPVAAAGAGPTAMVVGFALRVDGTANGDFLHLRNNTILGNTQFGLGINANQQLYLFEGGALTTALAASEQIMSQSSWQYVELVCNFSTGSATAYLNGVEVFSYTGSALLSVDTVEFGNYTYALTGGGIPFCSVDDVYATNTAVRLGERRVETLYPSVNGSVAWTPLTGANWQEVSEALCDGDASYVSTSTAGVQDLYGITSLSSTPLTIDAVQTRIANRKNDASSHVLNGVISSGGVAAYGAAFAVTGSYLYDCDIWPTNPNGGGVWTATTVNGAQIGQKLVS